MDIEVSSYTDMTQSMKSVKPLVYPESTSRYVYTVKDSSLNNYWNLLLTNNNLKNINFKGTLNSLL